jgi:hypothetical protein
VFLKTTPSQMMNLHYILTNGPARQFAADLKCLPDLRIVVVNELQGLTFRATLGDTLLTSSLRVTVG